MTDEADSASQQLLSRDGIAAFADINGFIATEVREFLSPNESFAMLREDTPECMAEFMESHGITSMFYEYRYIDESDAYAFPVDMESLLEGLDPEEAAALERAYDEWNDEVDEAVFDDPAALYFFAIYEGRVFGIEMVNHDYDKYLADDPVLTCLCQFMESRVQE